MSQSRQRPPAGKSRPKNRANRPNPATPSARTTETPPVAATPGQTADEWPDLSEQRTTEPTPAAAAPTTPSPPPSRPASSSQAQARQTAVERRAQRAAEAQRQQQRRRMRNLLIGMGVALVVALVAGYVIVRQINLQAIGVEVPDEGRNHINEGTVLTFQHYPPSSGTHYPSAQPAGIYRDQDINEGYWVHSLEHGYVVALVRCTDNCGPLFDQLQAIYEKDLKQSSFGNVKFLALKYNKPFTDGHTPPITMMAWDHEWELDGVDRDKIIAFYNKFVDQGPEKIP